MELTHDVHATKLRPHLNGHAENDALDNAGLQESTEAGLGLFALEAKSIFDLLVLSKNLWVVYITATVEIGKNLESLFPPVFTGEPARRAGKEEHADE